MGRRLPETEENIEAIFLSMPVASLILRPNLEIVFANMAYLEATHTVQEQLAGKHVFDVFPENPNDPFSNSVRRLNASFNQVLKTKLPHRLEIQKYDIPIRTSDNGGFEERYWRPLNTPVLDEAGEVKYIIHQVEDVTEIETTKKSLSQTEASEQRFKESSHDAKVARQELYEFFMQAPVPIAIFRGPDHIFTLVNPSFKELVGREVTLMKVNSAFGGRTNEKFFEPLDEVYKSGTPFNGRELLFEKSEASGETVKLYLDVAYHPFRTGSGEIKGVLAVYHDVTDRVLAKEAIEQNEGRIQRYSEAMPQLAFMADANGKTTYFNNHHYEYFGVARNESSRIPTESLIHPDDHQRAVDAWNHSVRTGETFDVEYRLRRKDGVYRWFLARGVPERDASGEIRAWYGTNTDIHEQKQFVEQLAQAKDIAERANQTKSAFLANMSHEIRTPLAAIIGFANLLKDRDLDPDERIQFLQTIDRSGKALTRIIDDILDLAKVEAGRLQIEHVEFSFYDLLTETVELFREKVREKSIYLLLQVDENVPVEIYSDPTRLRQILVNLIGNAVKFTDRGGIRVNVSAKTSAGSGEFKINVKDTGIGLTPEQKERLFKPFVQADESTTRQFGGTGLGLALSQRFAEAFGGNIEISECSPNGGCTFTLTFSAKLPRVLRVADRAKGSASATSSSYLKNLSVLVVDDSPDNLFLVKRLLAKRGALVETACDGQEAVQLAAKGDHDLVLMDIQMPKMDGYQAKQALDKSGYQKPVVALTAHAMKEEREKTAAAGFAAHLTKPLDPEELVNLICKVTKKAPELSGS